MPRAQVIVHQSRFVDPFGVDPGRLQPVDIEARIVAQGIDVGRDRDGRRQCAEIGRRQRVEFGVIER